MESGSQFIAADEPASSCPRVITPDLDDIEEIVHQDDRPRPPSRDLATLARYMRPAIRRRLKLEERAGRRGDFNKTSHVTRLDMPRNMDGSDASSTSNLTIVTSASSACTDPWSSSGFVEEEEDVNWDDQDEDMLLVPKLEPVDDDDVDMVYLKESTAPEIPSSSASPVATKRPRGRPRKYPKINPDALLKIAKGRSKTGCITCRKRKKKCDEAKPGCELNLRRTCTVYLGHLLIQSRHELREEFRHMRRLPSEDTVEEWKGKG